MWAECLRFTGKDHRICIKCGGPVCGRHKGGSFRCDQGNPGSVAKEADSYRRHDGIFSPFPCRFVSLNEIKSVAGACWKWRHESKLCFYRRSRSWFIRKQSGEDGAHHFPSKTPLPWISRGLVTPSSQSHGYILTQHSKCFGIKLTFSFAQSFNRG